MNQDKEHLQLLAIFHYVVAGLAALFSFSHYFTQQSALFSYLPRDTEQRNRVKNCHLNFLAGFLL